MSIDDYLAGEMARARGEREEGRGAIGKAHRLLDEFQPVGRRLFQQAVDKGLILDSDEYISFEYENRPFTLFRSGMLSLRGKNEEPADRSDFIRDIFDPLSVISLDHSRNPTQFLVKKIFGDGVPLVEWMAKDLARRIADKWRDS